MSSDPQTPPRLGSLTQAARGQHLKQARILLIVIGVLTILVNAFLLFTLRGQVKDVLDKDLQDQIVAVAAVIHVGLLLLGVLFVVFGIMIHSYPVPITVLALVLYIGANVILAVLDPANLAAGWIIKIIFIVALARAIKAAIAYEKERRELALSAEMDG